MSTFSLYRGAHLLCAYDIESGKCSFDLKAKQAQGMPVVDELDKCGFRLSPSDPDKQYRVFIGDLLSSHLTSSSNDPGGYTLAGVQVWPGYCYFESARGRTIVAIQVNSDDTCSDAWTNLLELPVCVLPSKLGEDAYNGMAKDLESLSRGLLVDLFGKSNRTVDIRFASGIRAFASREEELESILRVTERLAILLQHVQRRPASRTTKVMMRATYWGREHLSPKALNLVSQQGISLLATGFPVAVLQSRFAESFDIAEHRLIRAFLILLINRARVCRRAASRHIDAIDSDRSFRDIRLAHTQSIYESEDIPRLQRLGMALVESRRVELMLKGMMNSPFLQGVKPQLIVPHGGLFQRTPEYQEIGKAICNFIASKGVWHDGTESSVVTKLTSRLFEQWCFLQIVESFRNFGLPLKEWASVLNQEHQSKFIMDFERGLQFEVSLTSTLRLRLRYEPWILGQRAATQKGETLCRGTSDSVPWSPDIVLELMREGESSLTTIYAIVMDCKYSRGLRERHWGDTLKYTQIRSTHTNRQIVRQLWLISVGTESSIESRDPHVKFDQNGPSSPPDETICFSMVVNLRKGMQGEPAAGSHSFFAQFAAGVINYLRREFT